MGLCKTDRQKEMAAVGRVRDKNPNKHYSVHLHR